MKNRKVWIVEETLPAGNKYLEVFSSKKKALDYVNCIVDNSLKDENVIVDNLLDIYVTITSKFNKDDVVKYTVYYLLVK